MCLSTMRVIFKLSPTIHCYPFVCDQAFLVFFSIYYDRQMDSLFLYRTPLVTHEDAMMLLELPGLRRLLLGATQIRQEKSLVCSDDELLRG
jgi:hypothetical protein